MATQLVTINATLKWVKCSENNFDKKYDKYTLDAYIDDASKAVLRTAGCRKKPSEDDDGVYYKFTRDRVRTYKDRKTGEERTEVVPPPTVGTELDAEGYLIQMDNPDTIGNGSEAEITLEVYDSAMGKGTRLGAVRVTKLVPYDPDAPREARRYKF